MLDFKQIVNLNEEEGIQQQAEGDAVVNFFLDEPNELFKEFNAAFFSKYKLNASDEILRNLINAIRRSGYQNQYVVSDFSRFSDYFPLIDFLTFVIGQADSNQKPNVLEFTEGLKEDDKRLLFIKAAQDYTEGFKTKAVEDSWPLDYGPKTNHASVLQMGLRQAASKNLIAEATIEKLLDKSLKLGIYKLLEIRKKIRDKQNKVPPSNAFIDSLLLTPEKHAGTTVTVPTQYKRLYPDTSVRQLVELGILIKRFYEHEKNTAQESYNQQHPESKTAIETTIEEFFENKLNTGNQFEWRIPKAKEETEKQPDEDDSMFSDKYKTILKGPKGPLLTKQIPPGMPPIPTRESKSFNMFYKSLVENFKLNEANSDWASSALKSTDSNNTKPPTENETKNPLIVSFKGGYTIGNIKNLKTNDPAQKLYQKILAMSDYIAEGEPFSILGALKDISTAAKGLGSLGGPNLDR
jgi:hypothetical protein